MSLKNQIWFKMKWKISVSSGVNLDYLISKDNKKDNNFLFTLFQDFFWKTQTVDNSDFFFGSLTVRFFGSLL